MLESAHSSMSMIVSVHADLPLQDLWLPLRHLFVQELQGGHPLKRNLLFTTYEEPQVKLEAPDTIAVAPEFIIADFGQYEYEKLAENNDKCYWFNKITETLTQYSNQFYNSSNIIFLYF